MSDTLRRIFNWVENRSQNALHPAQIQSSTIKGSFNHVYLRSSQLRDLEGLEHIFEHYAKQIRELTLRDNSLTDFPLQLLSLCNLTSLSLACNHISYIPERIFPCFLHLQWLTLAENSLRQLPPDLAHCTQLKGLGIQGNNFYELPRVICQLENLETLLLQRNKLVHIPSDVVLPDTLQTLHLASNMLCSIPDSLIYNPPSCLTHLYLSGNPLRSISPSFMSHGYKRLITLDLHTCMLAKIDPYFIRRLARQCPDLRRLNLAINFLTELPQEIGLLSKLQWLNLNDNQLRSLPATIGNLTQIVKIGLVQNDLEDLPHRMFSRLQKLRKLDIRRNKLRYFPSSTLATASLKEVSECVSLGIAFSAIPRPASYLSIRQSKNINGNGGGSLRTLLFYDNQWMDSSGGIFCKTDIGSQEYVQLAHLDDLRWGMQTEHLFETPECLKQIVQKSMQDVRGRLVARMGREKTLESELRVQKYDKALSTYYSVPSLREIALRAHLKAVMDSHDTKEPPYIDAYPERRQAFLAGSLADSRIPEHLREQASKTAEQCDVCGYWYSQSQYQLGYSARLCDNLLNVPIRYRICSIECTYNGIFAIHNAAYVWGSCIGKIVCRNTGLDATSDEEQLVESEHPSQPTTTSTERGIYTAINGLLASLNSLLGLSSSRYSSRTTQIDEPMMQHERFEDVSHVTFPAPATTAFNHFPRDAIRLERF